MKQSRCMVIGLAAALLLTAGCETGKNKKEVYQHWNAARASVQGSLAAERYKLGNLDDSRKAVDEAIKLDPQNPNYRLISAKIHIERNELEAADQELATARKLAPANGEADYLAGVIYQRWQKANLALDYYTQATTKAPGELAYLMARSEMLVQLGRGAEAVTLLESKVTYFEYSGPLRDMLGTIYMQQGKLNEAIASFTQATVLSPDDLTIRERLARAQFRGKKYREALIEVDRVLKDKQYEKRADLLLLKGECHAQLGQLREARFALETALENQPSLAPALVALGKVALKSNDLDRAEICFRRAVAISPDDAQIHLGTGYLRMQQKRWDDALASFEKAAALAPKDPVAICMIGLVYEKTDRSDKAMEYYGKALQLDPTDEMARKLMAKAK